MKQQFLDLKGLTELVGYLKDSIANKKVILPYASSILFPSVGDINSVYIDTSTNSIYRWDSSNKKYEILAKAVKSVSISESTENGKITLTVDGTKTTVPIHGLKSAAYTESSAYATAAQGAKAESAVQSVSLASGTNNGTVKITVNGKTTDNIAVKGLGSAAYTASSAYATSGHTHTKAQIGLGNVDNTADKDKSVKHATTADNATTATNVSGENATGDTARHVWFSRSDSETKRVYNDNFKYNPATNLLTTNITGSAASANSVPWTGVTGKPSTFTPSAHNHDDSTITSLNASKLFGTIDIARLPHGALERCVIVTDDDARFKLTTADVQLGDTVKVDKTKTMYFVINESKLNSEEGYTIYTAGTATSVPWSGVTGKPSTFTPSAHTHPYLSALSVSGKTITYTKGDGTTGTITTQDTWRGIQNNLTSDSTTDSLAAAQGKILKGLVDGKLSLSGGAMTGNISYKGSKATFPMIQFIDNDVDAYGNGIAIGGGGLTIVGGGEAADVVKTTATHGGNERLILANDDSIEFYTSCQGGLSKATHTSIDNTGLFSGIASSANLINCTQLTNQDLNTLKDPGKFYYAAGNNNCTNTGQAVGTAFGLYVGRNAEGYRYQKMITTGNLIYYRTYNSTSWGAWSTNIDSSNYNSYAPTKTGTGASGTWGISITGNAATATKLATARSINGTNFDGSGNITTVTWGTARNVTIGNTKKSVNGSADVSWSLSEIGAAAASHTHSYLPLAGGTMTGALNFANNTWNIVGDDVYIGDMNIGGTLGVKGKNGNTAIKLVQYGASTTSGSAAPGVSWTCTGANTSTISGTLSGTFSGSLSGTATSANAAPWSGITGKPSTYPPSSHTHNYAGSSTAGGIAYNANALYVNPSARQASANYDLTNSAIYAYRVTYSIASSSMTTGKPPSDAHILTFGWDTTAGWGAQIAIGNSQSNHLYIRGAKSETKDNKNVSTWESSWRTVLDSSNYTSCTVTKTGSGASGTWGINISGNAAYPQGFQSRATSQTWGNQNGTFLTDWHTSAGGEIAFRENGSQLNVIIDGFFYQNEGKNLVLDSANYSNYAATKGHTHNYAGSGSVGGSANSAVKLDTATAGSATQPVYFSGGKPVACTYTLAKSVPADAKFTDTNTWRGIQNNLTSTATDQSLAAAQGKTLNEKKMGAVSANGFYGMARPDGNTSDWIRTTNNGIIPVQSGGRGSGHSALGTDSWYFSKAYVDHVYSTDVKIADKVLLQYDSTNACLNFVFS